jgi:GH15 family glucan-1,4-alpha-glucosidase
MAETSLEPSKKFDLYSFFEGTIFGAALGIISLYLFQYIDFILKQPRLESKAVLTNVADFDTLETRAFFIAAENLRSGIEERNMQDGQVKRILHAGYRNFRESWGRDFGFASYGLIALDDFQTVKDTLEAFFSYQTPKGQFPVKLHSLSVLNRFIHSFLNREQSIEGPLKAKYISGHGAVSLDGQALLIIAAINYIRLSNDSEFAQTIWGGLKRALDWLAGYVKNPGDGLLHQSAFSDWADTIARSGRILYTNVIYWKAISEMAALANQLGYSAEESDLISQKSKVSQTIQSHFWSDELGYFVAGENWKNLSSAGNLLAIAWELTSEDQSNSILDVMRSVGMAEPVPTRVVYPAYSRKHISIENRLAGLADYHTEAAWLWIGAWHTIALARTHRLDEAGQLLSRISEIIVRDQQVHEVYDIQGKPISRLWYKSESPLTWSAGMVVYAFQIIQKYMRLDS